MNKKEKETINEAIERMSGKINKPGRGKKLNPDKKPRWSASLKEAMGIVTQRLAEIEKRMAAPHGSIAELEAQIERYEADARKVLVAMQQQIEKVQSEVHTRIARVETTLETKERQAALDAIPHYEDPVHSPAIEQAVSRLINISEIVYEVQTNGIKLTSHHAIMGEFKKAIETAKTAWLLENAEDRG